MVDVSQKEFNKTIITEKSPGSYTRAIYNPTTEQFNQRVKNSAHSILEIGCGSMMPILSFRLTSGDLWVGCDPRLNNSSFSILIHKGDIPIPQNTELVVFPHKAMDVPMFKPNLLAAIAPNPKDIVDGEIFDDELKKFLDPNKRQFFVVVMDNRTQESQSDGVEARRRVRTWMDKNGFVESPGNAILGKLKSNSHDLGASNYRMCFIKNPIKNT